MSNDQKPPGGETADSDPEATYLRDGGGAGSSEDPTTAEGLRRPRGGGADDGDATAMRAPDDDPRTVLRGVSGADADEATHLRSPGADDDQATHLRGMDDADAATEFRDGAAARVASATTDVATKPGGDTVPAATASPMRRGTRTGKVILSNRYEFDLQADELGGGGMGKVYRALDKQYQREVNRNRYFAVKVLNDRFAQHESAVSALVYETDRTRSLNHDNIARVYNFERDGDTIYMVMELLEGQSLEQMLKRPENRDGLPKEQAMQIIRDVGSALAYAHSAGIVHSDFKPGNVLLTNDGNAKVIDFGIARVAANPDDPVAKKGAEVTRDVKVRGEATYFDPESLAALTPAYASLEMFDGVPPSEEDDVYALAVVGYMLLTGKHPYGRRSAKDVVLQREVMSPAEQRKEGLIPARPPNLTNKEWRAIEHGLAIRRADRSRTAQLFLDELFGETRRSPMLFVAGALVFAAIVGGGVFMLRPQPEPGVVETAIELNQTDLAAVSALDGQRSQAQALLKDDGFDAVWRRLALQALEQWKGASGRLVVVQVAGDEEAARQRQREVFDATGYGMRIVADPAGTYSLQAGPFADSRNAEREALMAGLTTAGVDFGEFLPDQDSQAEFAATVGERYVASVRKLVGQAEPNASATEGGALNAARANLNEAEALLDEGVAAFALEPGLVDSIRATITDLRGRIETSLAGIEGEAQRLVTLEAEARRALACNGITADRMRRGLEQARELGGSRAAPLYQDLFVCLTGVGARDPSAYKPLHELATSAGAGTVLATLPAPRAPQAPGATGPTPEIIAAIGEEFRTGDPLGGFELMIQSGVDGADRTELLGVLVERINALVATDVDRARDIYAVAIDLAPDDARLAAIKFPEPDPCGRPELVGRGSECRDALKAGGRGPGLVVVQAGGRLAITRTEVTRRMMTEACDAGGPCASVAGEGDLPATGVSAAQMIAYAEWLSNQSGYTYRLPTVNEWKTAAKARSGALDGNRNCTATIMGISRGQALERASNGKANEWGLINVVGNARELVRSGGTYAAVGGAHTDPLASCTLDTQVAHDGSGDPVTGFRLVREIP